MVKVIKILLILLCCRVCDAQTVTPFQYLTSITRPTYPATNPLPRLTRWGWLLDSNTCVEIAKEWGYALPLDDYATPVTASNCTVIGSFDWAMCQLALTNPSVYKLFVLLDRTFTNPPSGFWVTNSSGLFCNNSSNVWDANVLVGGVWQSSTNANYFPVVSPEGPDAYWNPASDYQASSLRTINSNAPINIILNGGEYGLDTWARQQFTFLQDARVQTKPVFTNPYDPNTNPSGADWPHYLTGRKGHQLGLLTSNLNSGALTNRSLYLFYHTGDEEKGRTYSFPNNTNWSRLNDAFGWQSGIMNTNTDRPSFESYFSFGAYTNKFDLLTEYLNGIGFNFTIGYSNNYPWVSGGWSNSDTNALSDITRYYGFLKSIYMCGNVGAIAGYFSFPSGSGAPIFGGPGFGASFNSNTPPHWLSQVIALGHVQATFAQLNKLMTNSDMISGPQVSAMSQDQPAWEFTNNAADANVRILSRKIRGQNEWLVSAWVADGPDRYATVTIPTLGAITPLAKSVGALYLYFYPNTAIQIDPDGLNPSAGAAYIANANFYQCLTCNESEVNSNVVVATNGDFVIVPPCTNHWLWTMTNLNSQNINLLFAGPLVGCQDNLAATNPAVSGLYCPTNYQNSSCSFIFNETAGTMIKFGSSSNLYEMRISGLTVYGSTSNAPADPSAQPCIYINGQSKRIRLDHIHMWLAGEYDFAVDGWPYGVIDHCVMWNNGYFGAVIDHQNYGGWIRGDGSWNDVNFFGTTNAFYLESNSGTNNRSSPGFFDAGEKGGGRVVVRNNALTNWNFGWHGTESSQRNRSARTVDAYNNTLYYDTNRNDTWFTCVFNRGGETLFHNNYMYGYDSIMNCVAFRTTPGGGWPPWGNCDGINLWDLTAGTIGAAGTHNGGNASQTLVDSTASWTVNQWTGGWMAKDTTSGSSSAAVTANTATTATVNENTPTSGSVQWNTGDHYQIAGLVTAVLDQPGRGVGDLITNDVTPVNATAGGVVAWPHEVLSPVYEWSNTYVHAPLGNPNRPFIAGDTTVISNRDFYDNVFPTNYTAYQYPHWLVGGFSPPPATPSGPPGCIPPSITSQPQSVIVTAPNPATFFVSAGGTLPLFYQWSVNTIPIAGATSTSYSTPSTSITQNGYFYTATVTNACGSVTSQNAILYINAPIGGITNVTIVYITIPGPQIVTTNLFGPFIQCAPGR